MPNCGLISSGFAPDCDNPIISGVNDKMWVFNYEDIAGYTKNVSNPEIIEGITLLSGKNAFVFEGQNFSNEPDYAFTRVGFNTFYNHQVRFKVFADDPVTKQQLNALGKGKFVVVTQNNYVNTEGNTAFTIYGIASGLVQQEGTQPKSSAETGGAHDILLTSHENALEPKVPATLFLTDFDTSKSVLTSLEA